MTLKRRIVGKPCQHSDDHPPETCPLCWLAKYHSNYRTSWHIPGPAETPPGPSPWSKGKSVEPRKAKRFSLECTLRGEPTGEVLPCKLCGRHGQPVVVYSCPIYGRCVKEPVGSSDAPRWCRGCPDKVLPGETPV